jgi:hypothetical protein
MQMVDADHSLVGDDKTEKKTPVRGRDFRSRRKLGLNSAIFRRFSPRTKKQKTNSTEAILRRERQMREKKKERKMHPLPPSDITRHRNNQRCTSSAHDLVWMWLLGLAATATQYTAGPLANFNCTRGICPSDNDVRQLR